MVGRCCAVRCVRLGCMGRVDLYRLDQHPLLTCCTSVMKLVRRAYLGVASAGSVVPKRKVPCAFVQQNEAEHMPCAWLSDWAGCQAAVGLPRLSVWLAGKVVDRLPSLPEDGRRKRMLEVPV